MINILKKKVKSIIQEDISRCYLCGSIYNLEEHHVFGGLNRAKSDKDKLVVYLCHNCHNRDLKHHSVHFDKNVMLRLHQDGERAWLKYYHKSVNDFINRYYKNYI